MLILTGGPRPVGELCFDPDGRGLTANDSDFTNVRAWRLAAPGEPVRPERHRRSNPLPTAFDKDLNGWLRPKRRWAAGGTPPAYAGGVPLGDGLRFVTAEQDDGHDEPNLFRLVVRVLADGSERAGWPFRRAGPLSRAVGAALGPGGRHCRHPAAGLGLRRRHRGEVRGPGRNLWRDPSAHPAGRVVLAVNNTPRVALLDPHAAAVVGEFDPGVGKLTSVAVGPDGLLVAAAGAKARAAVWDLDG